LNCEDESAGTTSTAEIRDKLTTPFFIFT